MIPIFFGKGIEKQSRILNDEWKNKAALSGLNPEVFEMNQAKMKQDH